MVPHGTIAFAEAQVDGSANDYSPRVAHLGAWRPHSKPVFARRRRDEFGVEHLANCHQMNSQHAIREASSGHSIVIRLYDRRWGIASRRRNCRDGSRAGRELKKDKWAEKRRESVQ